MASGDPFQAEDQTDEDFFDKLVGDDEFGLTGSGAAADTGDMARALSNMSLGDVGVSADSFEVESKQGDEKLPESKSHEKSGLLPKEIAPAELSNADVLDDVAQSTNLVKDEIEMGSPGSSAGKSTGSKGTSIKVVQWSSFSSGQGQFDMSGYGSYSDFFTGVPDGLASKLVTSTDDKSAAPSVNAYFGSFETQDIQDHGVTSEQMTNTVLSEQIDSQAYGASNEQVTAGNDSQYWENAYPGWSYDANTGQWYQVDSYAAVKDAQADGFGSSVANYQESLLAATDLADDGVASVQTSEISYLQQTAQSVVETVSDDCTTSSVSNWNQVPHGNIEYPSNMVFDPQYPGWYYDQNTLQWYTLESYTQSLQTLVNEAQIQQTQDVGASLGGHFSDEGLSLHNNEVGQMQAQALGSQSSQKQGDWSGYNSHYNHGNSWQPEQDGKSQGAFVFSGDKTTSSDFYHPQSSVGNYVDQKARFQTMGDVQKPLYDHGSSCGTNSFSAFMPAENSYQFNQSRAEQLQHADAAQSYYLNQNSVNYSQQFSQSGTASYSQFSYTPNGGRTLEGRPPHALVTFGFGGKLIVMKDTTSFSTNMARASQDVGKGEISVLNLAEIVLERTDSFAFSNLSCDYFHSLCRQSFPGPLVGGNAATRDLNKWIDERITSCESSTMDYRKGEFLRLLLSLLKISSQHYGKLRSPFGVDPSLQEADGPELAVTKLFASARKNSDQLREYGALTHCMHNLPSEEQIRKTAVEVQHLLVSGRRKEALQCAQEGQLWGTALVLAAQLGDKFYIDTVKQMAHRQFVSGSPLRTLCLLIAGQPADVFSMDNSNYSLPGAVNVPQQPMQVSASGMLDDWEENLAIITANRTKDDELVIIHLGDCLWKERGEVTAAHTCYLVAEAKFESYSDKARLCLIGADHWKCPRTYASPEAIQRTELYEYSKVLGNSQFILLPFQPYKLVYAYMLAEVGKTSDALKYCQAILKSLKSSGRDPEVETWKGLVSSLEERLRAHQQGGYSTNLAPAKLVGKFFTSIDRSLHRMIGAPPPTLPPTHPNHGNTHDNIPMAPKVGNSQSTMAMSSLLPSASVETISEWTGDSRKSMHNRSISEPDFGRSPKQINPSGDGSSADLQSKAPGASRLGSFGTQFLQKTIGWMSRSRQAKLGEKNKFYYDEKLKRWVEEGAEPPAEEAALPPPPTTASFQNHAPEYSTKNVSPFENVSSNGMLETKTSSSTEHSPGMPPMHPMQNQFSARGRMGVRSRYVDTFNKGGGMPAASFQSPSVPSAKPMGGAKFFVPSPVAASESTAESTESTEVASSTEGDSASVGKESSFSPLPSSSFPMQRFPSMDNIPSTRNKGMGTPSQNGNGSLSSRSRAASWSGSYSDAFNLKTADANHSGEGPGVPSSFTRSPSPLQPTTMHRNGGSLSDDLHEVEL